MKTPTLETERLILRPISLDDTPAVQEHINNWNIVRYINAPWPYPDDGALTHTQELLQAEEAGNQLIWTVVLKETKEF